MNWTEQQLADHLAQQRSANANTARFALGRMPTGTMNKTEARYASHLETLKLAGEVLWYRFEAIKLRLADNTFYTCDFAVMEADGTLAMHEVKGGFWMEDARVKTKVAAAQYPFRFMGVMPNKNGGWKIEEF
jgi:hypothetical protein